MGWIKIADGLPDTSENVWVSIAEAGPVEKGWYTKDYYGTNKGAWHNSDGDIIMPEFWMSTVIPDPPKPEAVEQTDKPAKVGDRMSLLDIWKVLNCTREYSNAWKEAMADLQYYAKDQEKVRQATSYLSLTDKQIADNVRHAYAIMKSDGEKPNGIFVVSSFYLLLNAAIEANAGSLTMELKKYSFKGVDIGDWEINIKQTKQPSAYKAPESENVIH